MLSWRMNMLTQARRAPDLGTAPPGGATHGPGASAWPPRHAVPRCRTTRRQNTRKTAWGPAACATTWSPGATESPHRPCGWRGTPRTGADGLARDRARGYPPRRAAGVATSPRMAPAAARLGHTPGRSGHPAAYTTRCHCGHANRDTARRQSSGPSIGSLRGGLRRDPAARTRTRAPPDPTGPATMPMPMG
jgi:hypothetical protein